MGAEGYLRNAEKGLIEVAPLAYMRGRDAHRHRKEGLSRAGGSYAEYNHFLAYLVHISLLAKGLWFDWLAMRRRG